MEFVRYGNLKIVKQTHIKEELSYHTPPSKYGFFAMPKIKQELYLVGSINKTQPHLFKKNKNDLTKSDLRKIKKTFTLNKSDYIWQYLGKELKTNQIISRIGSWYKTDISDYEIAFHKNKNREKNSLFKYSNDHYEVFIDFNI